MINIWDICRVMKLVNGIIVSAQSVIQHIMGVLPSVFVVYFFHVVAKHIQHFIWGSRELVVVFQKTLWGASVLPLKPRENEFPVSLAGYLDFLFPLFHSGHSPIFLFVSLDFMNSSSGFRSNMWELMNWKTTEMEFGTKLVEPILYFLFQIGYLKNL